MTHQRIVHVRLAAGVEWEPACARLEALAEPWVTTEAEADLELVRVDDHTGVLIVACADEPTLARLCAEVVDPWLAAEPLAEVPTSEQGVTLFALGRVHDDHARFDAMTDEERCDHFVRRVVASGQVWGLYDETWARTDAAGDVEALPFWPDRELAARCTVGPWQTFAPRAIDLPAFLDQWLGGMREDGIVVVLVPTPANPGAIVQAAALADALRGRQSA